MQENQTENKDTAAKDAQNGGGISGLFIRIPVTTVMLSLALIVMGMIGYKSMGVDMFPNVDVPYVTVQTILPGSNPE